MPNFPGSLLDNVQTAIKRPDVVGVVVVDEQGDPPAAYPQRPHQQQVLLFAARFGLPVWLIELNPNPANPNIATRTQLRAFLPQNVPVITKRGLNAFHNTNLLAQLQHAHVDTIVLMGFASNQCVKLTAVGGHEGSPTNPGPFNDGATGLMLTVMTCQNILRGGSVGDWIATPGVEFYERV
ncbi:isochorismatase hydrolase [Terriglobus saanensis SP1PR4]|uniref:Isochorismatase hydrolase n=2 Tax=Terriglobus saanensis TaxID=870903 RepID=E8V693_TERSS|nr:isochorismatase hydrolase [Terriglobus saanensis SP1PR4]